jgi:hypothetical protein
MKTPASCFAVALALGTITLTPGLVLAQDLREEGPIEIEKCGTIDKPGSYKLVHNLTFTSTSGTCLTITTNFVTIDLGGFTITGPNLASHNGTTAISAADRISGITVRSGSISGFDDGVDLAGEGSLVEGLRVFGAVISDLGIAAQGIVRGNTVVGVAGPLAFGVGISATGIITGNYVTGSRFAEYQIGQGSTVIGNTALNPGFPEPSGFLVSCPSNVTDNTTNSRLVLNGDGCNNTNNVAP